MEIHDSRIAPELFPLELAPNIRSLHHSNLTDCPQPQNICLPVKTPHSIAAIWQTTAGSSAFRPAGAPHRRARDMNAQLLALPAVPLVPKLRLGTHLGAKLCFAGGGVRGAERALVHRTRTCPTRRGGGGDKRGKVGGRARHPLHAKHSFARRGGGVRDKRWPVPRASTGIPKRSLGTRSAPGVSSKSQTLLHTTFAIVDTHPAASAARQAYPDSHPGGSHLPETGAAEVDTLGYLFFGSQTDAVYDLAFTFPHADPALLLQFSGIGLERLNDESWGIDNVSVSLAGVPEPTVV